MSKEKFLKELEKKLSLLSEDERNDTINEYRDIIEEKMKHGKKEAEAVKEFGSIDELSKEILSAYKLNPDYNQSESKKDFIDNAEDIIKKGAKKISEVTDEVVDSFKKSDFDMTSQNIIEIILKIILLLVFLVVLKVPFYLISTIGESVFEIGFSPIPNLFGGIWKILVDIIYVGVCILLIVKLILKYTKNKEDQVEEKTKKEKKEPNKTTRKTATKSESKITKKPKRKSDSLERAILLLVQLFMVFVFIIPLFFIILLILFGIILLIFFILKGVGVYGFLIFALGCLGFCISLQLMFYRGMFTKQKIYLSPFVVSLVVMFVGGLISLDYIFGFTYYNYLPKDQYHQKTEILEQKIDKKTNIYAYDAEIITDNTISDNQIKIELNYYPDFITYKKDEGKENNDNYISFVEILKDGSFNFNNKMSKRFMKDLSKQKIYDYSLLTNISIKIYVNDKTKDLVSTEY